MLDAGCWSRVSLFGLWTPLLLLTYQKAGREPVPVVERRCKFPSGRPIFDGSKAEWLKGICSCDYFWRSILGRRCRHYTYNLLWLFCILELLNYWEPDTWLCCIDGRSSVWRAPGGFFLGMALVMGRLDVDDIGLEKLGVMSGGKSFSTTHNAHTNRRATARAWGISRPNMPLSRGQVSL